MGMKLRNLLLMVCLLCLASSKAQNAAVNFDGVDDYIETKYMGISGSDARTIEAWIRTTANCDPNNGGKQKVICDYGSTATGGRFTLNVLFGNRLRIEVGGSGLMGQKVVNDGKWHHVGVSYNPKNTTAPYKLYVDGKVDTSGNITTAINTASSVPFRIGARIDNVNLFEGDIDNVKVYNETLSDSMIYVNFQKEVCNYPKNLVAYYKLNEGNASGSGNSTKKTATDYISSNDGTLYNFSLSGTSSNWIAGPTLKGGVTTSNISVFECSSYISPSGKKFIISGTFKDILTNIYGCDSIITIKLVIGNVKKDINVKSCDSFVSGGGIIYRTSGAYTEKYKTWRGCDSIINYNLTINKSANSNSQIVACDSFENQKGQKFYSSGSYFDTLKTISGCDSILERKIQIYYSIIKYDTINACDTAWINNKPYTQSEQLKFNYKTIHGCDSVHLVLLKITKRKIQSFLGRGCQKFVSESGQEYTQAGYYKEYFTAISGCDSIVMYDVQLDVPYEKNDAIKGCKSILFRDSNYYESQWVQWKGKTVGGCDSIINTYLNITVLDKSVRLSHDTLFAIGSSQSLQWLNCPDYSMVPNQTYYWLKPSKNGDYAVEVTSKNCVDTSDCITLSSLVSEDISNRVFIIIPNPSNGSAMMKFSNQFSGRFKVYDIRGVIVGEGEIKNVDNVELPALLGGRYQITLMSDAGILQTLPWLVY